MAGLRFKLSTGEEVFRTIESPAEVTAELEAFRRRDGAYADPYFEVDNEVWVSRDAVVTVGAFTEDALIR